MTGPLTLSSVQYVAVGDPVDVIVASSGATGTGAAATSIVSRVGGTTKTVTLAATVTVDLTYAVYVAGSRNNEMDGLRNTSGTVDRTLHSINSATAGNEFWDPAVRNVGTAAGSESVAGETSFELLADDVGLTGQGEVEVFLTSRGPLATGRHVPVAKAVQRRAGGQHPRRLLGDHGQRGPRRRR